MDAGSAQDISHLVMNNHGWYRLISTADYVRAGLWCLANLTIGASYLMLPVEIWHWRTALPFRSAAVIGSLFVAFIAFCGISHLSMIAIMLTAPWWTVLLIYIPTAAVSLGTAIVVRRERKLIVAALQGVGAALAQGKE